VSRIDIIGQNGGDGLHYGADVYSQVQKEDISMQENSTGRDKCSGCVSPCGGCTKEHRENLDDDFLGMKPEVIQLNEEEFDAFLEAIDEDNVNSPMHYTSHPSGIQCIQVTEHMNFCLGNAVKYIWRAGLKKDAKEDLKKAVWYINRELEKYE
jgi:hypothetical protein